MKTKLYFISGVCGVGKSTLIPYLKAALPSDAYDVRDFDERGVPDGADHAWRKSEVKKWVEIASEAGKKGVTTIICGFVKGTDLEGVALDNVDTEIILLDADAETVRKRLTGRYTKNGVFDENQKVIGKPVQEFIESNVYYCKIMREEFAKENRIIVDTSGLAPETVAQKVLTLIEQS